MLFNGQAVQRAEIGCVRDKLGKSDARRPRSAAARREGFPAQTIIFLDQEQGGRMLPEQKAYIYAWVDSDRRWRLSVLVFIVRGISAAKEGGENIVTADDIRKNAGARKIAYWVANDACPPSPGCTLPTTFRRALAQRYPLRRRVAVCPVS